MNAVIFSSEKLKKKSLHQNKSHTCDFQKQENLSKYFHYLDSPIKDGHLWECKANFSHSNGFRDVIFALPYICLLSIVK